MTAVLNLNFHGIGAPTARDFGEGERGVWVTPALLEATLDAARHRTDLTLSFDDGNTTDLEIVLPALTQRGLKATFFIVPDWLGAPGFITRADVRTLAQNGMTIGNHGLAHRLWTELTQAELAHEVTQGKSTLERLTDTEVSTLAIPYGAYNDAVLDELRDHHHYEHVFTSDGGAADDTSWLQPREHLRAGQTPADLERLLGGLAL